MTPDYFELGSSIEDMDTVSDKQCSNWGGEYHNRRSDAEDRGTKVEVAVCHSQKTF